MNRLGRAVALAALAGLLAISYGHRPARGAATAASGDTITLRARVGRGPWQSNLSIRLVKTSLIEFSLCALWDERSPHGLACNPAAGARLPRGTSLRLEQRPIARAVRRSDSPGWGLLATSNVPALHAALSNTVSGDRFGTVHYRVTLRDRTGKILARSNLSTVEWHR